MEINVIYDFIGGFGFANAINFECFDKEKYKIDFYKSYGDSFDYFYNKKYFLSVTPSQILSYIKKEEIPVFKTIENEEYVGNPKDIYIYPIKINTLFRDVLGNNEQSKNNKSCFDFISKRSLKLLKKKNCFLWIEHIWEGEIDRETFEKLYYFSSYYDIPADKIIVICNTFNINKLHENFLKKYPKKNHIRFCLYDACLLGKIDDYKENYNKQNTFVKESFLSEVSYRRKKALILNRRLRLHRLSLLSLLVEDELLEHTLSSFSFEDGLIHYTNGMDDVLQHHQFMKDFIVEDELINKILKGFEKLKKIKKQTLDFENLDPVGGLGHETADLYKDTYFSLVTETMFVDDEGFVSEKTFKPIIHYHPFVVLGSAYTLKHLKELGFKTFDKWWDESYDLEENHGERFKKVYDVLESLIKKTDDEWVDIYKEIKEVIIYNRNHLLSFGNMKMLSNKVKDNIILLTQDKHDTKNFRLF